MKDYKPQLIGGGAGVLVGLLALKSKNIFVLAALGVGGAIIASQVNVYLKNREEEKKWKDAKDYLDKIKVDIEATFTPKENTSSMEGMRFNKEVGYITPYGVVQEQNQSQYEDISFR
jgi:hypothetical protein